MSGFVDMNRIRQQNVENYSKYQFKALKSSAFSPIERFINIIKLPESGCWSLLVGNAPTRLLYDVCALVWKFSNTWSICSGKRVLKKSRLLHPSSPRFHCDL